MFVLCSQWLQIWCIDIYNSYLLLIVPFANIWGFSVRHSSYYVSLFTGSLCLVGLFPSFDSPFWDVFDSYVNFLVTTDSWILFFNSA